MNQNELVDYVVSELGKHQHPDDVIKAIAETGAMDWNTAKRFVYSVKATRGKDIARRRAPLLLVVAVLTTIVGAGISIAVGVATLRGIVIIFLSMPIPWLGNLVYFTIGMLAFVGGLTGILKTLKKSA